jgi:hypothetical protein
MMRGGASNKVDVPCIVRFKAYLCNFTMRGLEMKSTFHAGLHWCYIEQEDQKQNQLEMLYTLPYEECNQNQSKEFVSFFILDISTVYHSHSSTC